jgi:hypothetical protein
MKSSFTLRLIITKGYRKPRGYLNKQDAIEIPRARGGNIMEHTHIQKVTKIDAYPIIVYTTASLGTCYLLYENLGDSIDEPAPYVSPTSTSISSSFPKLVSRGS